MYVYVTKIKNKNVIKIGSTINLTNRLYVLEKDVGADLDNTYVCNAGESYRTVEEKLHREFSCYSTDLLVRSGGTELFEISCMEAVLDLLHEEGEILPFHRARKEFNLNKDSSKTNLKEHMNNQHKLSSEWIEENIDSIEDKCVDIYENNKMDGLVLQWLLHHKLDSKRIYNLFSGGEASIKLKLSDFKGWMEAP